MNPLKLYTITGAIFVLVLGTLSHFFFQWSNDNLIVGLFSAVNESTWEHMKLIFYPMLLYSVFAIPRLKGNYPCITSAFLSGTLTGTFLIPVIFYTYTGILGYHLFILDILTFVLSVMAAFYLVFQLSVSCSMNRFLPFLYFLVYFMILSFAVFSFFLPNIGLFADPASPVK